MSSFALAPSDYASRQRIGRRYMDASLAGAVAFFAALFASGFNPALSFLTLDLAAIWWLLSRTATPERLLTTSAGALLSRTADPKVISEIDQLRGAGRQNREPVGVILVHLGNANGLDHILPLDLEDVLRSAWQWRDYDRARRLDECSFSMVDSRPNLVQHFYNLSGALAKELRIRQTLDHRLASAAMRAGIAISSTGNVPGGVLLREAEEALQKAMANGRPVYFRQL